MLHTCYHILSNNNDEYVRTLEEVQTRIEDLKTIGENHIKVSQIFTEEDFDVDAIRLKEIPVPLAEININSTLVAAELL